MGGTSWVLGVVGLGFAGALAFSIHATSQNLESACATAVMPISPTAATRVLDLQERSYLLYFRENRAGQGGRKSNIDPPAALVVDVEGTPRADVNRQLDLTTSAINGLNIRGLGSVDVHQAGKYTLRVSAPESRGEVCLGYQAISDADVFIRCAGIIVGGIVLAVIFAKTSKKKPAPAQPEPAPSE